MNTSILIIEDERAICELIALNFKHAGFSVNAAYSAEEAEKIIAQVLPDVLIVDWMLPGQSGIQLAQKLRKEARTRHLPMIMLTARADEEERVLGLEAGFDDYVVKPFSPKELIARVRAVLRRRLPHLSEAICQSGRLSLNPVTHQVMAGDTLVELGPTEFRLLHFLMAHAERVYTRNQLLNEIWGDHVFIEDRTVDVYIRRLRSALADCGEEKRIETVRGSGYAFRAREVL